MGIVFKNNAKTTLASSLSNSATSATVTDGSVFPSLSAGEFFLLTFDDGTNNEICKCTARSGNTLTIVRAQESTTARAFSSGDAAEGRVTAGVLETIQENIAAKSANQTVYNTTTASSATDYDIGIDPSVEANAMVFLNGVMQHHDTFSFSGSTLTFDAAPPNGMALEVIVDNLINLQSSNLTVDTFTATSGQTDFVLSDTPAAETNLIVFVDGVFQDQDSYTISNNTLTITDGVVLDRGVTVYVINPVNIGTPSDGTVTSAKLSGNITMPGTLTVGSNDVAFDSPTFVVDNANSRVGLGTASPSVPVDIVGDVKMSANLTVDTSTLVVDSTNNRVGIGTSPVYPLHVQIPSDGSVGASFRYIGGTNNPGLFFSTNESTRVSSIDASGSTTGILAFKTSGTEYMRIDSSGNVGIGTTSPSYALDVYDVGEAWIRADSSHTTESTANSGLRFAHGGVNHGVLYHRGSDDALLYFDNIASSTRFLIDSSGRVGIGTSSPQSATKGIHVVHDATEGSPTFTGAEVGIFQRNFNNAQGAAISIVGGSNSESTVNFADKDDANVGQINYSHSSNAMLFRVNDAERMRIGSDGNVGIGHTDANVKLDVNGAIRTRNSSSAILYLSNLSTQYAIQNNGNDLTIGRDGTERMRIDTSGNVGINCTDQSNLLTVDANSASSGTDSISVRNRGVSSVNNTTGLRFQFNSAVPSAIRSRLTNTSNGAGTLSFYTSSDGSAANLTERYSIDTVGRLISGSSSFAHNTYGHAAVFTKNSVPNGVVVIEDSDVSSGIGNTVLNLYLRDQDPASFAVFCEFRDGGGRVGSITHNDDGGGVTYNTTSDYRLKENVNYTWDALPLINQLKPAKFNFIGKTDKTRQGFLAHEVSDIVPGSVKGDKDHIEPVGIITDNDGNVVDEGVYEHFCKEGQTWTQTGEEPVYQQLDYSRLVPLLTKAIQEQQAQIETLKQEIREIREGG